MEGLMAIIIWLVVIGLIFYVIWWGLGQIAIPEPMGKIVKVVVILVFVLIMVYFLIGILPPVHGIRLK